MRQLAGNPQPKAPSAMSLRKRIEKSELLATVAAGVAGRYLAFCDRTTDWHVEGLEELRSALADGPVLLTMWHSRSIMGALHWPAADAPLSSLHDKSPIGRVSGALQKRVGLLPIEMSRKRSNMVGSRTVLKRAKDGISIGLTGDGPLGPARQVKDAPLDWARATGIPIFCYAFATTKSRRLRSWDQMMVPHPFGKGAYVFRQCSVSVPRKMDGPAREALRTSLCECLDEATLQADQLLGLPPGP